MTIESTLKESQKLDKYTSRWLVHPSGQYTNKDHPPTIERVEQKRAETLADSIRPYARTALRLLERHRQQEGPQRHQDLISLIKQIETTTTLSKDDTEIYVGLRDSQGRKIRPALLPGPARAFNACIDFGLEFCNLGKNIFYCPSSMCLEQDAFDCDSFNQFLDSQNYVLQKDGTIKARVRLTGAENHRGDTVLSINPDDQDHMRVWYLLNGLSMSDKDSRVPRAEHGPQRDKVDFVTNMNEQGVIDRIYHIGIYLPIETHIYRQELNDSLREGNPCNLKPQQLLAAVDSARGRVGYDWKTRVKTDECFLYTIGDDNKHQSDMPITHLKNYDQLLRNPELLAGGPFKEFVNYVREHREEIRAAAKNYSRKAK